MDPHETFLKAIHEKWIVTVEINSHEKGIIIRSCIPFDYGPSHKYREKSNRYHFYDLNISEGTHNLSILPEQLLSINIVDQHFDPKNFVTWKPNWTIKRNWGIFS